MWLKKLCRRWMRQAPRLLRQRCRPSRMQKRLTLEILEDRTLLSPVSTTDELIAAINTANSSGGATTITLTAGLFNFTSANNSTHGANALPVITGNITIAGNNNFIERTGSMAYRLFDVASVGSLTLENLTLQGGLAQGTGRAADGGAIYSSGILKMSGVTVKMNTAQGSEGTNGGAALGAGGNGASAFGGGLYVAGGDVSLTNDILSDNSAFGGSGGHGLNVGRGSIGGKGGNGGEAAGGGLYVAGGFVSLNNNTLSSNLAQGGDGGIGGDGARGGKGGEGAEGAGGGLYIAAATGATLSNNTFSDNTAYGGPGGFGGDGAGSGSRFAGNGGNGAEGAGGGLYIAAAVGFTLSNDTFSGNYTSGGSAGYGGNGGTNDSGSGYPGGSGGEGGIGRGGGLYVEEGGSITLLNDTIANNTASGGFGGNGGDGGHGTSNLFSGSNGGTAGAGGLGGNGEGGGLYVEEGVITLLNDTLSSNLAQGGDGGNGGFGGKAGIGIINLSPGEGGTGGDGGDGGSGEGGAFFVPADVTFGLGNTLIAGNIVETGAGGTGGLGGIGDPLGANGAHGSDGNAFGPDVSGRVISSDRDLIGDTSGSSGFSTANGDILNPSYVGLGPLAYNGGPTQTMALLLGSPAIDPGDSDAPGLTAIDQRGLARIVGNAIDIGAYEYGATPVMADLSISGNTLPSTAPGGPITYTLIVTNNSPTAQSNVSLTDQLPANATLVSWTPAAGWSSAAPPAGSSRGTVSAWIGSLPANSSATFTLVVQVTPGTTAGTLISNTAFLAPAANPSANSVNINTPVLYAPMLQVVDESGIYNGDPFSAEATAVGIDGATPVAGSFSYAYYAGTSASGPTLSMVPVNAGTYTVVATFTSNDPNYSSGGMVQTTFTISPASIRYTIGNDTQAYGYPANLNADLPSIFSTGINGETLGIAYSSSGDTSTAPVGAYTITGVVSNGTGLASNYSVSLTNGSLTVLGSGVTAVGSTLWIVGGTSSNDNVDVDPTGGSNTGSTGVKVDATLNHIHTSATHNQTFTALNIFLYNGNDNVSVAPTLTINTTIDAGNGNDRVVAGSGNNIVTLGNGNNHVGLGDGANTVMVGNGNDQINVGNGNNVIVEGDGNDGIDAGNGDNLIVAGLGRHNVDVGNGSNILIDGSVQLTQNTDSLRQVLGDWIQYGSQATNVASIRSRLSVTYNTHYANRLHAGSGLDWFWATDAQDNLNAKPMDLRN